MLNGKAKEAQEGVRLDRYSFTDFCLTVTVLVGPYVVFILMRRGGKEHRREIYLFFSNPVSTHSLCLKTVEKVSIRAKRATFAHKL